MKASALILVLATFGAFSSGEAVGRTPDHLEARLISAGTQLLFSFKVQKSSAVSVSQSDDRIYLWNEDDRDYRYYMVGTGEGRRENLWMGVGQLGEEGPEYLVVAIRNIEGQFGRMFPQHLVLNMSLNGVEGPGWVEDGGFGIYPEREIYPEDAGCLGKCPDGVLSVLLRSTYYELGTNHFIFRILLEPGRFDLKRFTEKNISIEGDGVGRVKLSRSRGGSP